MSAFVPMHAGQDLSRPETPKITIDAHACNGCGDCVGACLKQLGERPNGAQEHQSRVKVLGQGPRFWLGICRQCAQAPCADACISGALVINRASGQVELRESVCIGCGMCVMVCPFGAIWLDDANGNALEPSLRAVKCDTCPTRQDPACVLACPTGALRSGSTVLAAVRRRQATLVKLTPDRRITTERRREEPH